MEGKKRVVLISFIVIILIIVMSIAVYSIVNMKSGDNESQKGKLEIFEKLKVGDYVSYGDGIEINTYNTDASKTGYINSQTLTTTQNTKWRVLYIDKEKGEVLITTQGPVNEEENILIMGATGYYNGSEELDNICRALYSNKILGLDEEVRSMRVEDLFNAYGSSIGEVTDNDRYAVYSSGTSVSGVIENPANGKTYVKKECWYNNESEYANGRFLVEQIDNDNESISKLNGGIIEKNYKYVEAGSGEPVYITNTFSNFNSENKNKEIINDIFNVKNDDDKTTVFLASPTISVIDDKEKNACYSYFGLYNMINGSLSMSALYHSSIGTVAANGCIRPVVTLNSEIQIEEGIGDGKTAETAWKLIKQ